MCRQGGGTDRQGLYKKTDKRFIGAPGLELTRAQRCQIQVLKMGHFKSQFEVAQCNRQEKSHLNRLLGTRWKSSAMTVF